MSTNTNNEKKMSDLDFAISIGRYSPGSGVSIKTTLHECKWADQHKAAAMKRLSWVRLISATRLYGRG